jgi:hypothetical protein
VEVAPSRGRALLLKLGAGLSALIAAGLVPAALSGSLSMTVLVAALGSSVFGLLREALGARVIVALRCTTDGRVQGSSHVHHKSEAIGAVIATATPADGAAPLDLAVSLVTARLIVLRAPGVRFVLWRDSVPASFYRRLAACGRWSAHRRMANRPVAP